MKHEGRGDQRMFSREKEGLLEELKFLKNEQEQKSRKWRKKKRKKVVSV